MFSLPWHFKSAGCQADRFTRRRGAFEKIPFILSHQSQRHGPMGEPGQAGIWDRFIGNILEAESRRQISPVHQLLGTKCVHQVNFTGWASLESGKLVARAYRM